MRGGGKKDVKIGIECGRVGVNLTGKSSLYQQPVSETRNKRRVLLQREGRGGGRMGDRKAER